LKKYHKSSGRQMHNKAPHLTAKHVAPIGAPCLASGGLGRYA